MQQKPAHAVPDWQAPTSTKPQKRLGRPSGSRRWRVHGREGKGRECTWQCSASRKVLSGEVTRHIRSASLNNDDRTELPRAAFRGHSTQTAHATRVVRSFAPVGVCRGTRPRRGGRHQALRRDHRPPRARSTDHDERKERRRRKEARRKRFERAPAGRQSFHRLRMSHMPALPRCTRPRRSSRAAGGWVGGVDDDVSFPRRWVRRWFV